MKTRSPARVAARGSIDLDALRAVVATADGGSLSAAARALGLQLSTVSRQVAQLERAIDVTLLVRTGRGVRLTPAGERYVERARRVLLELDAAEGEARADSSSVASLRVAAPVELSLRLLPAALVELARRHPGVVVSVAAEARRVSLLEEDFDAAVRIGALEDSRLVARPLGSTSIVFVARPSFGSQLSSVTAINDAEHVLVGGSSKQLVGVLARRDVRIRRAGALSVSTFSEAAAIAALSDRVAMVPAFTASEWIRSGALARVLPELELPSAPVHLLLPHRNRGVRALRTLGELLSTALGRAERAAASAG